jgi:hypothetical protein
MEMGIECKKFLKDLREVSDGGSIGSYGNAHGASLLGVS